MAVRHLFIKEEIVDGEHEYTLKYVVTTNQTEEEAEAECYSYYVHDQVRALKNASAKEIPSEDYAVLDRYL